MNAEDLQSPGGIRYANVHLSFKATKSPEGGVNVIGTVGGCHDNNMGLLFQPIYKGQQLGHNLSLHFTMGLLSLWYDAIQLINKGNCRCIFLCLLKGFPEVALRLSCHLAHDLRSIDEEKEGSSFIGHCPGNQGLASTRWTIQEDATRGLNSNSLKQLWVSKWQLRHLLHLRQLLTAATNIIAAHFI